VPSYRVIIYNDLMSNENKQQRDIKSGECLIAQAGVTATALANCLDEHQLMELSEFLGLLRHNLDIIRGRRRKNH